MRVALRTVAVVAAMGVVLGIVGAPTQARALVVPPELAPYIVGVPSTLLAAAGAGSPAVGAQLAGYATYAEGGTVAFAAAATKASPLVKTVPGLPGMIMTSYAVGTVVGGGLLRTTGVDPQEMVCGNSDGVGQLVAAIASGNDCVSWNAEHPSFVPNQDQYPKFSSGNVCDNSVSPARCFQIVGSKVVVFNGYTFNIRCFKNQNYTGWAGMYNQVAPQGWKYFASGTLQIVYSGGNVKQSACASFGANYYSQEGSSIWSQPGFTMAFYQAAAQYYTVKTNSTSSGITTTYPDPSRVLRCEIVGSNFQTYSADSATFLESGGEIPELVCPALPAGVFLLSKSIKEVGGGTTLQLLTQSTTQAYQDWANSFPDCSDGDCALELFRDGTSCWTVDEACMDWVDDPNRNAIYSCEYAGLAAPIEWCYVYGSTFSESNRDSGNAYADPATGHAVPGVQTSPTLEDDIVASLMDRLKAQKAWMTLPEADRRDRARSVAAQCIALSRGDDCKDMAIFAPGGDVMEAAQHDLATIEASPALIQLTYLSKAEKVASGVPEGWYGSCSAESLQQCDEYPYYASVEGAGPGSSVKAIDAIHNQLEGSRYGNFVVACNLGTTASREYLVIPIPIVAVPTAFWCEN